MGALDHAVKSGRALYAGISSYQPDATREAARILRGLGTPCLIHQPSYNLFNRWIEDGLLDALGETGMGCIAFSPLAQGLLTNRYLDGIPDDSRAAKYWGALRADRVTDPLLQRIRALDDMARARGQSLAQMAIAWVLRHPGMTSALVGASRVQQVEDCAAALDNLAFSPEELAAIQKILAA